MVPQDEEIKMLEWASMRARHDHREAAAAPPDNEHFEQPPVRKSPIALALGGGAARGWAHIGVLRALDEAGIEISMIAGTSIGALVGGCYLAGKLDQLEEFARSLTKRRMFGLLDFNFGGSGLFGMHGPWVFALGFAGLSLTAFIMTLTIMRESRWGLSPKGTVPVVGQPISFENGDSPVPGQSPSDGLPSVARRSGERMACHP